MHKHTYFGTHGSSHPFRRCQHSGLRAQNLSHFQLCLPFNAPRPSHQQICETDMYSSHILNLTTSHLCHWYSVVQATIISPCFNPRAQDEIAVSGYGTQESSGDSSVQLGSVYSLPKRHVIYWCVLLSFCQRKTGVSERLRDLPEATQLGRTRSQISHQAYWEPQVPHFIFSQVN